MKIIVKNENIRTCEYEIARKIATGLLEAGYQVSVAKERFKVGNQYKNYWTVDYEERTNE